MALYRGQRRKCAYQLYALWGTAQGQPILMMTYRLISDEGAAHLHFAVLDDSELDIDNIIIMYIRLPPSGSDTCPGVHGAPKLMFMSLQMITILLTVVPLLCVYTSAV